MPPFTSANPVPDISAYSRTNLSNQSLDHYYPAHMTSSRGSISSAASSQSGFPLHTPDAGKLSGHTQSHLIPGFTSTAPTLPGSVADDASARGTPGDQEQTQLFACPYTKYDPARYSASNLSELNYRGCGSCYLTDISRLKQHLYRVHERPHHYCPVCYKTFKAQDPRDRHIASRSCTEQPCPFDEKMTPEQLAVIKKKNRGTDPTDCWYDIYQTLFRGKPQPHSPFASFSNTPSTASLDTFMQYLQDRAPRRFRQHLSNNMIFNETVNGQILMSLETSLGSVLRDIRMEFDQNMRQDRAPTPSMATGLAYDDDDQAQRFTRKRKATDSSLQIPTSFQYSMDAQSLGSYGDVSAPQSLLSTPALRDDEPEPSSRRNMVSPALRFAGHGVPRDNMQESLHDPMIRVVTNESQWQASLATASEPTAYYQLENPATSSPQPMMFPEADEWQTNMMTGANLTMGMGQPGYPANAPPRWMGKGGNQPW